MSPNRTTPSPRPTSLAPLLHLLAGAILGSGLVWIVLLNRGSNSVEDAVGRLRRGWSGVVLDAGLVGAVGGLLGGLAAGTIAVRVPNRVPGIRFWMVALGSGGALTFGAVALRDAPSVPTSESGGPAAHVLVWLVVGWLIGVLMGAVGAAFAQAASPGLTTVVLKGTTGRTPKAAPFLGAMLGAVAWATFWGALVALLVLLALGIVVLSVRTGAEGPALAVGGTCGCVFFGLRYVLLIGSAARR